MLRVLSLGSEYARCCQEINYERVSPSISLNSKIANPPTSGFLVAESQIADHPKRIQEVRLSELSTKGTVLHGPTL
jgi:hypothetical protein